MNMGVSFCKKMSTVTEVQIQKEMETHWFEAAWWAGARTIAIRELTLGGITRVACSNRARRGA
jgi:hypothetical protein